MIRGKPLLFVVAVGSAAGCSAPGTTLDATIDASGACDVCGNLDTSRDTGPLPIDANFPTDVPGNLDTGGDAGPLPIDAALPTDAPDTGSDDTGVAPQDSAPADADAGG